MCARPICLPQFCSVCNAYTADTLDSAQGNAMTETRGKTIHVTKDVHDRLTARGKFKDSYNDIIKRRLDGADLHMEGEAPGEEESSQ